MTNDTTTRYDGELQAALEKVKSEIIDGLEHGFFEFGISGELINGGKSRLTIWAGKNYRFVIPPRRPKGK